MTDLPTTVAFDHGNPTLPYVLRLIDASSLSGLINVEHDHHSMVGTITILSAGSIDPEMWSSGEQQLWWFIASLAGLGFVNLRELAGRFRGGEPDVEAAIIACFTALWTPA